MERCCEQGSATRKDADKIGAIQFFGAGTAMPVDSSLPPATLYTQVFIKTDIC